MACIVLYRHVYNKQYSMWRVLYYIDVYTTNRVTYSLYCMYCTTNKEIHKNKTIRKMETISRKITRQKEQED